MIIFRYMKTLCNLFYSRCGSRYFHKIELLVSKGEVYCWKGLSKWGFVVKMLNSLNASMISFLTLSAIKTHVDILIDVQPWKAQKQVFPQSPLDCK